MKELWVGADWISESTSVYKFSSHRTGGEPRPGSGAYLLVFVFGTWTSLVNPLFKIETGVYY